jgi:hypothetical protein
MPLIFRSESECVNLYNATHMYTSSTTNGYFVVFAFTLNDTVVMEHENEQKMNATFTQMMYMLTNRDHSHVVLRVQDLRNCNLVSIRMRRNDFT